MALLREVLLIPECTSMITVAFTLPLSTAGLTEEAVFIDHNLPPRSELEGASSGGLFVVQGAGIDEVVLRRDNQIEREMDISPRAAIHQYTPLSKRINESQSARSPSPAMSAFH